MSGARNKAQGQCRDRSGPHVKHFVFVGYYPHGTGPAEVVALLARIRANNKRDGITGVMLYDEGSVMQVVEGPDEAVDALCKRLRGDRRIGDIIDLHTEHSDSRLFPGWPMGCGPDVYHLGPDWTPAQGLAFAEPSDVLKRLPPMIGGLLHSFDSRRRAPGVRFR